MTLNVPVMDDLTAVFGRGANRPQYANIENDHDGCGWTAGWIGFCTATGDMYDLVVKFDKQKPNNPLATYEARLTKLADSGSDNVSTLTSAFPGDWREAAADPAFRCTPGRQADWPDSVGRAQALQDLANAGNWTLKVPIHVGHGFNVTISKAQD